MQARLLEKRHSPCTTTELKYCATASKVIETECLGTSTPQSCLYHLEAMRELATHTKSVKLLSLANISVHIR
jgi:hypothetical protein